VTDLSKSKNQMLEFLSGIRLCSEILSLDIKESVNFDHSIPDFSEILNSIVFPKYDEEILREIRTKASRYVDISKELVSNGYNFVFYREIFEQISVLKKISKVSSKFFVGFVLHSFLSWIISTSSNQNLECISSILRAFNLILRYEDFYGIFNCRLTVVSAFYESMAYFVSEFPESNIVSCIKPLDVFYSLNTDLPPHSYDLLVKIAGSLIDPGSFTITETGAMFLSRLGKIIEHLKDIFPQSVLVSLQMIIQNSLLALDDEALKFCSRFIQSLSPTTTVYTIAKFPEAIVKIIESRPNPINPYPLNTGNVCKLEPFKEVKCAQEILRNTMFSNNTPFIIPDGIFNHKQFKDLIPDELRQKLSLIADLCMKSEIFAHTFLTSCAHNACIPTENPYIFDIIASLMFIIEDLWDLAGPNDLPIFLCQSSLFDNKIHFWNSNLTVQMLGGLRNISIDRLLVTKNWSDHLIEFLRNRIEYPDIFAEVLYRICDNKLFRSDISDIPVSLIQFMFYYQSMSLKSSKEQIISINRARSSILCFINSVILNERYIRVFDDVEFVSMFSTLAYEEEIRDHVLNIMCTVLSSTNSDFLSSQLKQMINVILCSPNSDEGMVFIEDLLNSWLSLANQEKFDDYIECLKPLHKKLMGLVPGPFTQKIIIFAIKIIVNYNFEKPISEPELKVLEESISKNISECSQQLYHSITHLIAGKILINIKEGILIINPHVVSFGLSFLFKTDFFESFLEFLQASNDKYPKNRKILNQSKVDIDIISLINSDENIPNNISQLLLCVLEQISNSFSTLTTVNSFISFLCKKESSNYNLLSFNYLFKLISEYFNSPYVHYPINSKSTINIIGWSSDRFLLPFTIIVWLNAKSILESDKCSLVSFGDQEGNYLQVVYESSSISIYENSGQYPKQANNILAIRTNSWVQLVILYKIENNSSHLVLSLKNGDSSEYKIDGFHLSKGQIEFVIGNPTFENDFKDDIVYIGKVSVLDNNKSTIEKVLSEPPNEISLMDGVILSMIPKKEDQKIIIDSKSKSGVEIVFTPVISFIEQDFLSVLFGRSGISLLLPLFSYSMYGSFQISNETNFLSMVINMFYQLFCIDPISSTKDFETNNSFQIISHHLNSYKRLDYNNYLQFYMFLKLTNENCRHQLISSILVNFDLWARQGLVVLNEVVNHWKSSLFPYLCSISERVVTLSSLISFIRVYLWYSPVENGFISCENADNDDFLKGSIRNHLFEIILHMSKRKVSPSVFRSLCINVLTSSEIRNTRELIELICKMVVGISKEEKSQNDMSYLQGIISFQYLLFINDEDINKSFFKLLIFVHCNGFINSFTLEQHIQIIIPQLPPKFGSIGLFECLSKELIGGLSELLPICIIIALNINIELVGSLLSQLKPSGKFCNSCVWPVWIIIASTKSNSIEFIDQCTQFLFKSEMEKWDKHLVLIHSIGISFNIDINMIFESYIRVLIEYIPNCSDGMSIEKHNIFSHVVIHFLFFRRISFENSFFDTLYSLYGCSIDNFCSFKPNDQDNSPLFVEKVVSRLNGSHRKIRIRKGIPSKPLSFSSIVYQKISEYVSLEPKEPSFESMFRVCKPLFKQMRFGLRVSSDGEWIDQNLAQKCYDIIKSHSLQIGQNVNLVFKAYLGHANQESVPISSYLTWKKNHSLNGLSSFVQMNEFFESFSAQIEGSYENYVEEIIKYYESSSVLADKLVKSFSEDFAGISARSSYKFIDSIEREKKINCKIWNKFWQVLTIDKAPWNNAISSSSDQKPRFKRDHVLCVSLIPIKMRRNYRYIDHKNAAEARDAGSSNVKKNDPKKPFMAPKAITKPLNKKENEDNRKGTFEDCPCQLITITRILEALFSINDDFISISRPEYAPKTIKLVNVSQVLLRTWNHQKTAIEIFCVDGSTFFINFTEMKSLDILRSLPIKSMPFAKKIQNEDFLKFFIKQEVTELWVKRKISTFQYICMLNLYSGRSYNALCLYPIFPWVLVDYESKILELTNPKVYRDFSKPIGFQDSEKMDSLQSLSQHLLIAKMSPYCFSYGPVYPRAVCNWMIRIEPFTTLHIDQQAGKVFDEPKNIFYSISETYKKNDFHELIPEFFYSSEFLQNDNRFNLGSINGETIDDVIIPPWAHDSFDFIYLHRKALESSFTSSHIHEWFDLFWGDRNKTIDRTMIKNLYPSEMYPEIRDSNTSTPKEVIDAILQNVGQIPEQLFNGPHPQRNPGKPFNNDLSYICKGKIAHYCIIASAIIEVNKQIIVSCINEKGIGRVMQYRFDDLISDKQNEAGLIPGVVISENKLSGWDLISDTMMRSKTITSDLGKNGLLVISSDRKTIYLLRIKNGSVGRVLTHPCRITSVASDKTNYIICDEDSSIHEFKNGYFSNVHYSIRSFRSSIKSCAISSDFHTIIAGTSDSFLLFCSMNSKSIIRVVELNDSVPQNINISPLWGFVLVSLRTSVEGHYGYKFELYTINGEKLKTQDINHNIVQLISLCSSEGFDYTVFSDTKNDLFFFETYYLNNIQKIGSLDSPTKSISYLTSHDSILVITNNGTLYVFPTPFSNRIDSNIKKSLSLDRMIDDN